MPQKGAPSTCREEGTVVGVETEAEGKMEAAEARAIPTA